MSDALTALARLTQLHAKIDAFFQRVVAAYPGELQCAAGCTDCCQRDLTITPVEAARITQAVRALPKEARAALAQRARGGDPCVALGPDGRCAVYEARPIVCRSHGVPIRYEEPQPKGKRALPVLDACSKNFTGRDLGTLDPAVILDQHTLSLLGGAIDNLYSEETGALRGARLTLRDVLLAAC